ncbi:DUF4157 domain-containing protein [Variovorax sp. 770b2]|uniref:eCIS core domain-containing protein n=1 Tax=Variovorax sp. 770b2 TaxID=1566271 RepID=UPI0008E3AF8F|nr:DUF4157 domain-containing protein [Variovorax sp. 770b2]SFP20026.1 DYW family of nucleic acid deaminases [Variovorax sp. 770b2]
MADTATQASPTRTALRVPDTRRPPPRRVPPATSKPAASVAPVRVSQPSDPAEREAVRVSQRVLAMAPAAATPQARRFAKTVPARGSARSLLPSSLGVGASVGQPLPRHLKHDMEPRFGADFSAVRVHTGDAAARASRRLNAAAFTVGHEVFFGRDRFAPGSIEGRGLIAHELTHTIQQGGAAQPGTAHRSVDTTVRVRSEPQVQRLGVQDALDYFAGKADSIPGFSMFALVLGMNPINGRAVDRSPANVFRALVRFVPGGDLIVKALDTYGVFDKIANWFSQQVDSLGMVGASFKQAVYDYADSLGPGALLDLGGAWDRAVRIFTTPWNQVKTFVGGLAGDILTLIKDAVLKPLAALAATTPAYPLLKAVLGRDPVTGDESPGDAQAILGGIMTLAGQGEVWGRVQSTGAIGRVVAWFNDAKKALVGFVKQVPALAMAAFTSLELMDIVVLPRGLAKVAAVFGNFVASFIGWGVDSAMKLAEIVFEVVSPGAWGTIQKTGSALKNIIKDPLPFVSNLGKAAKLGFQNFAGNFLTHLQNGLIKWLTGSLSGVYIPTALSLPEIVKFAFSVLGLSWGNLRGKLVKGIGETAVVALEKGFGIVMTLKDKGPAAAWEQVKAELAALKDQVIEGIKGMIIEAVVTKAIPKLVAMFIPGAGFISAIVSIYDMVMVFINKISEIAAVVSAFVGSISAIAGGNIGAAAGKVESVLAGGLSLAINFLAGFAGLGKIAAKINGILQKIRAPVDKALDSMVAWVRKMAKKFLDALLGKNKKGKDGKPDARTDDQKKRDVKAAVIEGTAIAKAHGDDLTAIRSKLGAIKNKYKLVKLDVADDSGPKHHLVGEINPIYTGDIFTAANLEELLAKIPAGAKSDVRAAVKAAADKQKAVQQIYDTATAGGIVKPTKTLALVDEITISGWGGLDGTLAALAQGKGLSVTQQTAEVHSYVVKYGAGLAKFGYSTKSFIFDPKYAQGAYFKSHAEKQAFIAALARLEKEIDGATKKAVATVGVTRPMCPDDCFPFFKAVSSLSGRTIALADPSFVWVFTGGQVIRKAMPAKK